MLRRASQCGCAPCCGLSLAAGLVYNDMRYHNVMLDRHCNLRIIDMGAVTPSKHFSHTPTSGRAVEPAELL